MRGKISKTSGSSRSLLKWPSCSEKGLIASRTGSGLSGGRLHGKTALRGREMSVWRRSGTESVSYARWWNDCRLRGNGIVSRGFINGSNMVGFPVNK
jgi:hypothetical protein